MLTSGWSWRKRLLGVAIILAMGFPITHLVGTGSGAYTLAVATAHKTPQFGEMLGTPIREGWFPESKFTFGEPWNAKLLIPVRGRLRGGNLRALAVKDGGNWKLTELTLELTQPDEHIDLLQKPPI
jgi:Cytochrome oxidase complex assembly protein 1